MIDRDRFWYDRQLWQILSSLDVADYDVDDPDADYPNVTLQVELPEAHFVPILEERADYLAAARGEEPDREEVIEHLATEVATALQIEYNTVSHDSAEPGQYEPHHGNDTQWRKVKDEVVYDEYSDILYDLTGRDVDYDEVTPSIPALYEPFVSAVAESEEHELPAPGAVRPIISEHLEVLRRENQSTAAQSALKRELERAGISPRTSSSVAKNVDSRLFKEDSELVADDD